MKRAVQSLKSLVLPILVFLALPAFTPAQHYQQTNLVSDISGMAPLTDPNLKNPWGITRSATSPWWVANNNSGTSTLYTGAGAAIPINGDGFVTIPPPAFEPTAVSTPTGVVVNGSATDFLVTPGGAASHFIFDTEDGTISAWATGKTATLEVDNSDNGSANGAVYKGLTSGEVNGKKYLYATNFRSGKVEIYDTTFKRVHFGDHAFDPNSDCIDHFFCIDDDRVPEEFAPFNIQNIGDVLFVTYAKQD